MMLDIMRKNPNVCFEVESMSNMANWQSVILNGTFHELKGNEAEKTRDYLLTTCGPF